MYVVFVVHLQFYFFFGQSLHLEKNACYKEGNKDKFKMISILAAGVVGALTYTFTDSFWFSAVEGEAYAMSSFHCHNFLVYIKMGRRADQPSSSRWLILIAYLIGLSIAFIFLAYLQFPQWNDLLLQKYEYSESGAIKAFIISMAALGFVQGVLIQVLLV